MKSAINKFIHKIRTANKYSAVKKYYGNVMQNPLEIETPAGNNFLVAAPHPDDEIIGCGGLICKLLEKKKKITVFYNKNEDDERKKEALEVNKILGIEPVFTKTYFRTEFKNYLNNNDFDALIIPNILDNHKFHFKTVEDIYFIFKNSELKKNNLKIIMFEVWTPAPPNIIVDITSVFSKKIDLLKLYKSQLHSKNYISSVEGLNTFRSIFLKNINEDKNKKYAEAFMIVDNPEDFIYLFENCESSK